MEISGIKIPPISKEGYVSLGIAFVILVGSWLIFDNAAIRAVFLVLFCIILWFFRDPNRTTNTNIEGAIFAPADGIIQSITLVDVPEELKLPYSKATRVSIFMNPFNVHVNRSPISGTVTDVTYKEGKFVNVSKDKDSEDNEKNYVTIESNGTHYGIVQIAGFLARRIVCHVKEGNTLDAGERFGIIKFGSRVDIFLPENYEIMVAEGQTSVGGETLISNNHQTNSK